MWVACAPCQGGAGRLLDRGAFRDELLPQPRHRLELLSVNRLRAALRGIEVPHRAVELLPGPRQVLGHHGTLLLDRRGLLLGLGGGGRSAVGRPAGCREFQLNPFGNFALAENSLAGGSLGLLLEVRDLVELRRGLGEVRAELDALLARLVDLGR